MRRQKFGGRKAGTPNRVTWEMRDAARQYGPQALATLVGLMRSSRSEKVRVACADLLLDRGYGRVPQAVAGPLVNVNFGMPAGGQPMSAADAYALICGNPQLPADEVARLIAGMRERPALEAPAQVLEGPATAPTVPEAAE